MTAAFFTTGISNYFGIQAHSRTSPNSINSKHQICFKDVAGPLKMEKNFKSDYPDKLYKILLSLLIFLKLDVMLLTQTTIWIK